MKIRYVLLALALVVGGFGDPSSNLADDGEGEGADGEGDGDESSSEGTDTGMLEDLARRWTSEARHPNRLCKPSSELQECNTTPRNAVILD